ncbi:MAG: GIY-YIG nuclease family protein [candidate division Zixibacteria bacterium]|nr:GIY-YIG nuclease family protein [candidate division Zixibacteria bacterium]
MKKTFFVYILTNPRNSVLYTGITNNLTKRVSQHSTSALPSFTKKYQMKKLIYYEMFDSAYGAIRREKQIKGGSRRRKVELINKINPNWEDLSHRLF